MTDDKGPFHGLPARFLVRGPPTGHTARQGNVNRGRIFPAPASSRRRNLETAKPAYTPARPQDARRQAETSLQELSKEWLFRPRRHRRYAPDLSLKPCGRGALTCHSRSDLSNRSSSSSGLFFMRFDFALFGTGTARVSIRSRRRVVHVLYDGAARIPQQFHHSEDGRKGQQTAKK